MTPPVLISTPPENLVSADGGAGGVELKLDWDHAERVSAEHTVADDCVEQGGDLAAVTSVHLPPGTTQPEGMSVAPGNVGPIVDFTTQAFGDGIAPEWLTVHTARQFEYREHVERLATLTDLTGYSLAVENLPDPCYYHTPEDVATIALLAEQVPRLSDVSVLLDTAHVPMARRAAAIDDTAVEAVLERLSGPLHERMTEELPAFLESNLAACRRSELGVDPPAEGSPWRPVYAALALIGGAQVRALHLNHPETDGLPIEDGRVPDGVRWILAFCRSYDVAVVLEPGGADASDVATNVEQLQDLL